MKGEITVLSRFVDVVKFVLLNFRSSVSDEMMKLLEEIGLQT